VNNEFVNTKLEKFGEIEKIYEKSKVARDELKSLKSEKKQYF